ncbi:NSs [Abras virus]|uniref:NSs n=2 Tax=Orthobunyavirus TaxID=11572 RepID=A0A346JIW5_9VIRU|nr:NSs [Abras virus]AXP33548.1 NSs [Abras virus]AXP33550.1 NSs [Babahoya virus]QLA47002.1 NSs [Abras virus]
MEFSVTQQNTQTCHSLCLNLKTPKGKETFLNLSLETPTGSLTISMENFLTSLQLTNSSFQQKPLSLSSVRRKPQELHCAFEIGELRLSTTITQDWARLKFYRRTSLCIAFQVSLLDDFLTLPMEVTRRA